MAICKPKQHLVTIKSKDYTSNIYFIKTNKSFIYYFFLLPDCSNSLFISSKSTGRSVLSPIKYLAK